MITLVSVLDGALDIMVGDEKFQVCLNDEHVSSFLSRCEINGTGIVRINGDIQNKFYVHV